MHREGYRLPARDLDNFKFGAYYFLDDWSPYFIFGSFCTINSDTEGSQTCSFNHETDNYRTWIVTLSDTLTTGSGQTAEDLSAVSVDRIVLCSNPPPCPYPCP